MTSGNQTKEDLLWCLPHLRSIGWLQKKSQLVDSQMEMKLVVVSSSGSNAINPSAWNIELKFEILGWNRDEASCCKQQHRGDRSNSTLANHKSPKIQQTTSRGELDKATLPFRWIFVVKSVMISWIYPNIHSSAIAINPYTWDRSHIEFGPFKI